MNCDPELAQGLYFEHKVSSTLDNEQKASMRRELSALQNVSNNLDRAAKVLEGISTDDDQLRTALRIEGLNYLLKRILSMPATIFCTDEPNFEGFSGLALVVAYGDTQIKVKVAPRLCRIRAAYLTRRLSKERNDEFR
jgi:hypothetical protein